MRAMHEASSLTSTEEVASWRESARVQPAVAHLGQAIRLDLLRDEEFPADSIGEVILRRGSTRRFAPAAIGFRQFSTVLDRATRGIPADFLEPFGSQLNDIYLIVNAVEGISPGAYFFDRGSRSIFCLKEGNFRREAGYLALEQDLASDASCAVFFLADLERLLGRFGNRGYRAVQLEAGIIGGKLYLAAYAQRLGATGLTFYDDDVAEFFMPHSTSKNAIFLVAIGKSARQKLT
jgi:SagB-type dehydrogenase family enzyme